MKFILYGHYSACTYVDAYMATKYRGLDLEFVELDCEDVLVAFDSGGEIGRTYDMTGLRDWVEGVAAPACGPHSIESPGGAVQDPLPGLECPPCR
jgi:hypothetical protein